MPGRRLDAARRAAYSVFFLGLSPLAPGTVASAAAAAAILFLLPREGASYALAVLSVAAAAFLASVALGASAERIEDKKDPSAFVLDEVAGQAITLLSLSAPGPGDVLFGFVAFRLFDIVKPFPARRLEGARGGWGIALDDAVAGIYANVALHLWRAVAG